MKKSWLFAWIFVTHADVATQPGFTVRNLNIKEDGTGAAHLRFAEKFEMGLDSTGAFSLTTMNPSEPIFTLADDTFVVHAPEVSLQRLEAQELVLQGQNQWRVHSQGTFSEGWTSPTTKIETTQCGGVTMIGGYCKFDQTEVRKVFGNLSRHSYVKLSATFHFIDRWAGETAFMKLNVGPTGSQEIVWTERYEEGRSSHGLNVCGDPTIPEGKFAALVEVVVPHSAEAIEVVFGTTMDTKDPCDRSWGISNIEIQLK